MSSPRLYAPDGRTGSTGAELAALPASLAGRTIVALDNGKPGALALLEHAGRRLAERTGASFVEVVTKGSAATPCEDPLLDSIIGNAELVLTGTAD